MNAVPQNLSCSIQAYAAQRIGMSYSKLTKSPFWGKLPTGDPVWKPLGFSVF